MEETLLVRIAETVGSRQAENVASAALTYLLQRDKGIRTAFVSLVEGLAGVRLGEGITFRGQVPVQGLGVTDISGVLDGSELLIVEAKILAGLGAGQATAYLRRLPGGGVLVLLAPMARLDVVFREACRQSGVDAVEELRADAEGIVIIGVTWEQVLDVIEGAALDSAVQAEVHQVVALYRRIESNAFIPFSSDDLSVRAARLWSSMDTIVTRVKSRLSSSTAPDEAAVVFPTRWPPRGGERFYGAWCSVAGFNAWFGRHTDHWATREEAPYWLQLNKLDQAHSDSIASVLADMTTGGTISAYRDAASTDIFVPLRPPVGVDQEGVVNALVAKLTAIARLLVSRELRGPLPPGVVVPGGEDVPNDGVTRADAMD